MDPYDRYRWSLNPSAAPEAPSHSWISGMTRPVKGQVPEWCGDSSTTETCAGLVGQEIAAWPLWRRAFEEVLQPNWQRKAAATASTGTAGEPDTLGHSQIPRWAANHVDILYWRLTNLLSQSRTSPEGRHGILSVPQMTYQHITDALSSICLRLFRNDLASNCTWKYICRYSSLSLYVYVKKWKANQTGCAASKYWNDS